MKNQADYSLYKCPFEHIEKDCGHELHGPEGWEDTYGIWCPCGFRGPVFFLEPEDLNLEARTPPAEGRELAFGQSIQTKILENLCNMDTEAHPELEDAINLAYDKIVDAIEDAFSYAAPADTEQPGWKHVATEMHDALVGDKNAGAIDHDRLERACDLFDRLSEAEQPSEATPADALAAWNAKSDDYKCGYLQGGYDAQHKKPSEAEQEQPITAQGAMDALKDLWCTAIGTRDEDMSTGESEETLRRYIEQTARSSAGQGGCGAVSVATRPFLHYRGRR